MKLKSLFPFFTAYPDCVYLDSAATTQKPQVVIDNIALSMVARSFNVHRSSYPQAQQVTSEYEQARLEIANFIGAEPTQIVFTKGATEALNLLADALLDADLLDGEEILVLGSEHHANLLPWRRLAQRLGLTIRTLSIDSDGYLDIDHCLKSISAKTALFAFAHVSNVLGRIHPVNDFIQAAQAHNCLTVVDGTQALAHLSVDVHTLDCDMYVASGHKMYGPQGTGLAYAKTEIWQKLSPYQLGGEMVEDVSLTTAAYLPAPHGFEAGTQNVMGQIGLAAAVRFLTTHRASIERHEQDLLEYLQTQLLSVPGLHIYAAKDQRVATIAFNIDGWHSYDVQQYLAANNILCRAGRHCAMPLMEQMNIDACCRFSLGCYNDKQDIDRAIQVLQQLVSTTKGPHAANSTATLAAVEQAQVKHDGPIYAALLASKNWENKYRNLLLASKHLALLAPNLRVETHLVKGCEAAIWMARVDGQWQAYSPSKLIRGLLALMLERVTREGVAWDLHAYLEHIGLANQLSESRLQGLAKVWQVIQQQGA